MKFVRLDSTQSKTEDYTAQYEGLQFDHLSRRSEQVVSE